jgi:hypothetical protein
MNANLTFREIAIDSGSVCRPLLLRVDCSEMSNIQCQL